MDPDDRVHDLLLVDALDDILVAHVKLDGVACRLDAVRLQLNRLEESRKAVELSGILGIAGCNSDVVRECRILIPQAEVLESWVALEELWLILAWCSQDGRLGSGNGNGRQGQSRQGLSVVLRGSRQGQSRCSSS